MPRAARIAPNEYVYHVLTRGNNRQNIFKDENDHVRYINVLEKYKSKFSFKLYHYVLMTNHVHLVMEPTDNGGSLAEIMKGINLSYAQYYKGRYTHIGHFWQDRYKSIIISKDDYLLACGSYVELNPVRAKIVEDPKDYKWSSYGAHAYGRRDVIVDEHPIYKQLADNDQDNRKRYRELVKGMLREKNAMKGEMDRKVLYGSKDFIEKVGKRFEVGAVVRPKGRPKGNGKERK